MEQTAFEINGVKYHQSYRKCSKPECHCREGQGHGPYWYASGVGEGAKYVGAQLPQHVLEMVKRLREGKAKIARVRAEVQKRMDFHQREYRKADDEMDAIQSMLHGGVIDVAVLARIGLAEFYVEDARPAKKRGKGK